MNNEIEKLQQAKMSHSIQCLALCMYQCLQIDCKGMKFYVGNCHKSLFSSINQGMSIVSLNGFRIVESFQEVWIKEIRK